MGSLGDICCKLKGVENFRFGFRLNQDIRLLIFMIFKDKTYGKHVNSVISHPLPPKKCPLFCTHKNEEFQKDCKSICMNCPERILYFIFNFFFTEVPMTSPVIHGLRPRYKVNDIIRGNCTSKYSRPATNLTWTINDIIVSINIWTGFHSATGFFFHSRYRLFWQLAMFHCCRFSCSN